MIQPPTSEISHHYKVTNITMSPTSLSPLDQVIVAQCYLDIKGFVILSQKFLANINLADDFQNSCLEKMELIRQQNRTFDVIHPKHLYSAA